MQPINLELHNFRILITRPDLTPEFQHAVVIRMTHPDYPDDPIFAQVDENKDIGTTIPHQFLDSKYFAAMNEALKYAYRHALPHIPAPYVFRAVELEGLRKDATERLNKIIEGPPLPQTYVVQPAESLRGIAERELGDEERWYEIARLNSFEDCIGKLYPFAPGTIITMPADYAPKTKK